ncbi:MAG: metallophosphoesterase [Christensenellaceae bacterium]|jgi:hypothetical protein|nr:metallophosphoesterase [Christensenellaceae bacterium]
MKIAIKVFATIIACVVLNATLISCVPDNDLRTESALLQFSEDGKFTILQIADPHEWMGIEKTGYSLKQDTLKPMLLQYMEETLNAVNPDLVVLTGDNIFCLSAINDLFADTAISIATYRAFAAFFREHKQYWTFTFGNHDSEGIQTKQSLLNAVDGYEYFIGGRKSLKYCEVLEILGYDDAGKVDDRIANFNIPIYNDSDEIAYSLFLLDSGSYSGAPAPSDAPYRYILPAQTEWYVNQVNNVNTEAGRLIPSLIFTHIPLIEFEEMYKESQVKIGELNGLAPSDVSSTILDAVLENGATGFFTGHNHETSITFAYQGKSGAVLFGVTPNADGVSYNATTPPLMRSRVIELSDNGDILTYIHTNDQGQYPDSVDRGETIYVVENVAGISK